jgi:hypothetical protein
MSIQLYPLFPSPSYLSNQLTVGIEGPPCNKCNNITTLHKKLNWNPTYTVLSQAVTIKITVFKYQAQAVVLNSVC